VIRLALLLWVVLVLAVPPIAHAQVGADSAPLEFRDDAEEARFHALAAELRCVMCQNQSLADSNALIALSLRREVLDLMRQGRSDAQVKEHLVARYGEFVLYRPRLSGHTWLLWAAPLVLLLVGGGVVAGVVRRRGARPVPADEGQEW
jgi:cytochrome c-type biogenesis protein CcmH